MGTFGPKTERAVQSFQSQIYLFAGSFSPGYGIVGPRTRAKIAEVCAQITNVRVLEIARANGLTAPDLDVFRGIDKVYVQSCNLSETIAIHPNTGSVILSSRGEILSTLDCNPPIEEEGKVSVLKTPEVQTLIKKYGREHVHVMALDINLIKDIEFIKKIHPKFKEETGCVILAHAGDEGYVYQENKDINIIYHETLEEFLSKKM